MNKPIGTVHDVYFTQADLDFSKRMIAKYRADEKRLAKLARTANPNARGAYAQKAAQAKRDAGRWEKSLKEHQARVGKFGAVIAPHRGGDWIW